MEKGPISQFIVHNYRHFNSATLIDASKAYDDLINRGGKMMLAMAGAMSTAELGISLAEMIRQDKFSIVCCSANNLEEDIMNLLAHSHYYRVPGYRDLTPQQEKELLDNHYNRVTDTCIPEEEAFRRLEGFLLDVWKKAQDKGERYLPYEYIYQIIRSGVMKPYYEIDPKDSWVLAACEKNIPIIVPAFEDCEDVEGHCERGKADRYSVRSHKMLALPLRGLAWLLSRGSHLPLSQWPSTPKR
jgi:deoxyhypusine synthase